jgi:thiol-disulfide isomerase/thioredoxin
LVISRCGKCQELAPAWEKLAEQWKDNSVGLIAEVDCDDDDNHVLCEEMEINQYPTLLFGDPFEMELYDGNLELEDLSEFAKEHLVTPICSPANLDACAEDEKTVITELQGRSVEELTSLEDKAAELLHHAHLDYEEEIENLQNLREKLDTSHHEKLQAIHQEYNYKHLRKVLALKRDEIKSEEL